MGEILGGCRKLQAAPRIEGELDRFCPKADKTAALGGDGSCPYTVSLLGSSSGLLTLLQCEQFAVFCSQANRGAGCN